MSTSVIARTKKTSTLQGYAASNAAPSFLKSTLLVNTSSLRESTDPDMPRMPWHEMNLKALHTYRHAHHLNTPSSQTNPQAQRVFADAARKGVYSPSVVLARRRQREWKKSRKEAAASSKERGRPRLKGAMFNSARSIPVAEMDEHVKQTKEQLAMAVRKHFNAMSVSEGEVVARFTYVVRHLASSQDGDPDKSFRMRFTP